MSCIKLSLSNSVLSIVRSQYKSAGNHYRESFHSAKWKGRVVHAIMAVLETIPLIGTIIYLGEKRFNKNNVQNESERNLRTNFIVEDDEIPFVTDSKITVEQFTMLLNDGRTSDLTRLLLEGKLDPDMTINVKEYGEQIEKPVLDYLCCGSDFYIIQDILAGINPNQKTVSFLLREGFYSHHSRAFPTYSERFKVSVEYLIEKGALPWEMAPFSKKEHQYSALAIAIETIDVPEELVKILINRLAEFDIDLQIKGTGENTLDLLKMHRPHLEEYLNNLKK